MSTQPITDYLTAIAHLADGGVLRLEQISWDVYEDLLNHLGDRPGYRVSYNRGRLEIMSPLPEHEEFKEMFLLFARIVAEELGILLETRGSATYKQKRQSQGVEPDTSFYVQNATAMIGKRPIDLELDPPPDVVVEIDIPTASSSKFPIYASIGMPEIWG